MNIGWTIALIILVFAIILSNVWLVKQSAKFGLRKTHLNDLKSTHGEDNPNHKTDNLNTTDPKTTTLKDKR